MSVKASVIGKDGHCAFCVFKRRLGSVMAFFMNRNFLFFVSAIVLVALAACGKGDEESAATANNGEKGAAVSQPAKPAESGSAKKGLDLVKSLRDSSGVVSPEEKAAAIKRARTNAVDAAKAVGQTDQQAQAAGEAAAAAAERSFGEGEPQQ